MASHFMLSVLSWVLVKHSCIESSPEWFKTIPTELFNFSGDIKLGGLFHIQDLNNSCNLNQCKSLNVRGLSLALVMKYAVDEINGNPSLLPGVKLGYEIYDTAGNSSVVVKPSMSFLTAKSTNTLSVKCNYTNYETSVAAVIGPETSEMVSVIGKLLGFFLMPQISYGATSDKFSDSLVYPSFFRTVPTDKWQVDAIARLMTVFNWTWVAVVGSEEEYGQRGVQQFSKIAENMSVCVAYQGLIPVYTDAKPAINTIIKNIEDTEVKVVVVFSLEEQAMLFFEEVIKRNLTGVWIASSSWAINDLLTSLPNIKTIGTVIGLIDTTVEIDQLIPYTHALFTKLHEERANTSPHAERQSDPPNPCPQCWNLSPANISLVDNTVVNRTAFGVYAAVYSVAEALHKLLQCNSTACKWRSSSIIYPWKLLEALRNTSINIKGTKLEFDESGNPNLGYNVIQWNWGSSGVDFDDVGNYSQEQLSLNISLFKWHTNDSSVPTSTCSAKCGAGQVRRVKGFHSCCFDCIDCVAGTYQANPSDIQCTKCPNGRWSKNRSTNCTDPIYKVLAWDTPEAKIMILAVTLLLICQGSVCVVFLMHRGTPVVMASGGALSFVALFSLMGAGLSLLLFLGQPGDLVCRLQLPLISIFQTVALSIITSVSLQIFFVTEFPEVAASYLQKIRGPGSWLCLLICCVVEAGLCGWFVQEGPSLTDHVANMTINFVESFLACPVQPFKLAIMQGFNGSMALVSFMCTFMAARPLHQYNLARDITFSTLIYCVVWVVFIPVYTGFTISHVNEVKKMSIIHVYFSLVGNLGLVVAYYFPKCYFLLRRPDFNTAEHFCTFLEGVPPKQPQEEQQPPSQSDR
ncbi:taste receptor type 1 member 3 [Cololabis saira]|uniref:taste receptor type 1 member 3 n=1 Tax=Cololabis saira TaxID=129043 RepID=UPI002AD348BF|nr:taste receptor type 1 member 3 [Cololabis saira]